LKNVLPRTYTRELALCSDRTSNSPTRSSREYRSPKFFDFDFPIRKHSLFSSVAKPLSIHSPGSLLSRCELPRVENTYAHQGIVSIQMPEQLMR
jgi:hypothetical protein